MDAITRIAYDGTSQPEQKVYLRKFRLETLERRAFGMLADKVGCVSVTQNDETVLSIVRQAPGEDAYKEDLA